MEYIFIGTIIYMLAGLLQFPLKQAHKLNLVISLNSIATIFLMFPIIKVFNGEVFETQFYLNAIFNEISLKLDALSAFFALIIGLMSLLVVFYSKGYLKPYIQKGKSIAAHLFFFNIFIVSMLFVVISQNILFFLISWEIMSLSSFFLMMFEDEKNDVRKTAVNYFIKMHVCVIFLILGFALLAIKNNSLSFDVFASGMTDLSFILLFLGFGIKSGIAPMHTWLPKAHPVAPTHVSALMSGVMIKTGIYGIFRMLSFYPPSLKVAYLILLLGLLSAFFGVLYSIAQRNYKKMLAYSSVENIGIIIIGLAVGMLGLFYKNNIMASLGFIGALMHVLNHSLFKSLLFMCVGEIYNNVHKKDMEKLGGLLKKMPMIALFFLIGSLSISALPVFNGFISEFCIYLGFLNGFETHNAVLIAIMIISMAILAFVGSMVLIAFTNIFGIIFLGNPRTKAAQIEKVDTSKFILVPLAIISLGILFIGLFPQYAVNVIKLPLSIVSLSSDIPYGILTILSKFNISFLLLFAFVFGLRMLNLANKTVDKQVTWSCGYDKCSPKIQYTANSFTRPFLGFLTPFYVRILGFNQIKETFPHKTSFSSSIKDVFNVYLIEPIVETSNKVVKKFYFIQSGNMQTYLLYGVLFLVITIACLMGGKL